MSEIRLRKGGELQDTSLDMDAICAERRGDRGRVRNTVQKRRSFYLGMRGPMAGRAGDGVADSELGSQQMPDGLSDCNLPKGERGSVPPNPRGSSRGRRPRSAIAQRSRSCGQDGARREREYVGELCARGVGGVSVCSAGGAGVVL